MAGWLRVIDADALLCPLESRWMRAEAERAGRSAGMAACTQGTTARSCRRSLKPLTSDKAALRRSP